MPIGDYQGPTATEFSMEKYLYFVSVLISFTASPVGPQSSMHAAEISAGIRQEVDTVDYGPICGDYDPELAAVLGAEF